MAWYPPLFEKSSGELCDVCACLYSQQLKSLMTNSKSWKCHRMSVSVSDVSLPLQGIPLACWKKSSWRDPKELVDFLQAPATWERVLVVAEENVTDMFVRRYATAFDVMWGKIAVTTMACLGS